MRRSPVAYVLRTFPKLSETFILGEITALIRAGREVRVFALERGADLRMHPEARRLLPEVRFAPLAPPEAEPAPPGLPAAHETAWRSREWLSEQVADAGVGHLHAHFAGPAATLAWAASRDTGIPFTFTAHAKDIFSRKVAWPWLRRVARDSRAVVTVCDYNRRWLVPRLPGASVVRLHNGVDLERWTSPRAARLRASVLAVGRLVPKKGFDVLIRAMAGLGPGLAHARLTVVGDGPERERLAELVVALGLERRVRFLGERTQPEVRRLVRRATVVALACVADHDGNQDALPTVLLEACACGTPCVSTRVAGVPEIVRHGRTGLVVAPGDPAAFGRALSRLLLDPRRRARMGREARRHAQRRFARSLQIDGLSRLFSKRPAEWQAVVGEVRDASRVAVC